MFRVDITMEDSRVIASRGTADNPDLWQVECHDNHSGKMFPATLTDTQMQGLAVLVFTEDNSASVFNAAELQARELLRGIIDSDTCPHECSPFP